MDGEAEASLVALLCGPKPQGAERWSLRLVGEKLVELEIVSSMSHETVRQVLKKRTRRRWLKKCWCIPPEANANFASHMGDVLCVYKRPCDARFAQMCMDEGGKTLLAQTHESLPMQAGRVEREDDEYERNGTCSVFVAVEPLSGKHFVQVSARRTKADWASCMRELIEFTIRRRRNSCW